MKTVWTWTAHNKSTYLMDYRTARTRQGALRAAKAYLRDDCGGEGVYIVTGYTIPEKTELREYLYDNPCRPCVEIVGKMSNYE